MIPYNKLYLPDYGDSHNTNLPISYLNTARQLKVLLHEKERNTILFILKTFQIEELAMELLQLRWDISQSSFEAILRDLEVKELLLDLSIKDYEIDQLLNESSNF